MKANENPGPTRTPCPVCPRHCMLKEGQTGACGVRTMTGGRSASLVWGRVAARAVDPVEKKPLWHVQPGSATWSLALPGCSMKCRFCQNHHLSQAVQERSIGDSAWTDTEFLAGLEASGCPSVSFTYSEPLVWHEWVREMAMIARAQGRKVFVVSNGWCSQQTLQPLLGLVDAWNIDLKGDDAFYRQVCAASIEPVLRTLETICQAYREGRGGLAEVTTMVIQGIHGPECIRQLGKMLKAAGVEIWHLTRFHPDWRMRDRPATTESCLQDLLAVARESGIPFIYGGNSRLIQDTLCSGCSRPLISRDTCGRGTLEPGVILPGRHGMPAPAPGRALCPDCGQDFPLVT